MLLTRRNLMITGGAAVVVGGGVSAWALTASTKSFLADFLRHSLPGIKLAPGAAEEYVADYLADWVEADTVDNIEMVARITRLIGFGGLDVMLSRVERLDIWRRVFISRFVASSDLAYSEPSEIVEVGYLGPRLECGRNPWAQFD